MDLRPSICRHKARSSLLLGLSFQQPISERVSVKGCGSLHLVVWGQGFSAQTGVMRRAGGCLSSWPASGIQRPPSIVRRPMSMLSHCYKARLKQANFRGTRKAI